MSTKQRTLKWSVSYSPTLAGPYAWVADEYADSLREVEQAVLYGYAEDETPLGFYRLRPEIGGAEYLIERTEAHTDDWPFND